jgi:hypothetical protein
MPIERAAPEIDLQKLYLAGADAVPGRQIDAD